MDSRLPDDVWSIIFKIATTPQDIRTVPPQEQTFAQIFDPHSVSSQRRYPWRHDFKMRVDTKTSVKTKHSLSLVSKRFYELSAEFLFQSIYICHDRAENLDALENALKRKDSEGQSALGKWAKYMYFVFNPISDSYMEDIERILIPGFIAILQHLQSLKGLLMFWGVEKWIPDYRMYIDKALEMCPDTLQYLDWRNRYGYGLEDCTVPIVKFFRRMTSLRAMCLQLDVDFNQFDDCQPIRESIEEGSEMPLPSLQYMDVNQFTYDLYPKLSPNLSHISCCDFRLFATPDPAVFANLIFLCLKNTPAIACRSIQFLLEGAPKLTELVYLHVPKHSNLGLWRDVQFKTVRKVEFGFKGKWYLDDTSVHEDLARYLALFGTPERFPVVEKLRVSGLRYAKTWKEDDRVERLHGMLNEAWKNLIAQGAQISFAE